MENKTQTLNEMFEVEKIINSRIYRNKKYYLIKWLCYPINESTWEPKSNLKNLNYMLDRFEAEYPYSIDQNMYNIYCDESKKGIKKRNKAKSCKQVSNDTKFISKKKKYEYFSDYELRDIYYDKLRAHLHINLKKKKLENEIIIELNSNSTQSDESASNDIEAEKNNEYKGLIIPKIN